MEEVYYLLGMGDACSMRKENGNIILPFSHEQLEGKVRNAVPLGTGKVMIFVLLTKVKAVRGKL